MFYSQRSRLPKFHNKSVARTGEKQYFKDLNIFMSDIAIITDALIRFRDEREWEQFHNPKDLSVALAAEVGELLELFLWKNADEANPDKIKEELADIFSFAFLLANKYKFDVKQIVLEKIVANNAKYPVEKAKGSAKKYNEL